MSKPIESINRVSADAATTPIMERAGKTRESCKAPGCGVSTQPTFLVWLLPATGRQPRGATSSTLLRGPRLPLSLAPWLVDLIGLLALFFAWLLLYVIV